MMDENMSVKDDQEELLSSTEVDESSLMGEDEKQQEQWCSAEQLQKRDQRSRSKRKNIFATVLGSYRWLIDIFLLVVIVGLLILLRDQYKKSSSPETLRQVGGDFTGAAEKFPTQVVKFEADFTFAPKNMSEFFTDETLARWKSLMPAGTGYGPAGETFFTTSMTHQLHCVYMLGRIYSGVMTQNTHGLPWDYNVHFLHCIDYLRQAIMCSADLALEAHDETDPDDLGPLDGGWNAYHVCKNYDHVIEYLEEQIKDGVRVVLPIDD